MTLQPPEVIPGVRMSEYRWIQSASSDAFQHFLLNQFREIMRSEFVNLRTSHKVGNGLEVTLVFFFRQSIHVIIKVLIVFKISFIDECGRWNVGFDVCGPEVNRHASRKETIKNLFRNLAGINRVFVTN